jgi:threonine dehydratase
VVTLEDIENAREAVYQVGHRTPLVFSSRLSERYGHEVYLKAECLQYTGSFKVRGAANRLSMLTPEEQKRGVIAASAGNHAQGVAVAARRLGIKATVVMPKQATLAKVQAARRYGANVLLEGEGFDDALATAQSLAEEHGYIFIPAFDDERVIAGQGTLGLELLEDCPDVDDVIVPVGGGGLIAGIATALKARRPAVRIAGVQAAAAPAVALSFRRGRRAELEAAPTVADGVAIGAPGRATLPIIRRHVDQVVTVDEETIAQAIVLLLEDAKLVVEGAGALGVAALLSGAIEPQGKKTIIVLSGGNIDINMLATIVQRGLLYENRYFNLRIEFEDRPGSLAEILGLVASTGANVLDVVHFRQEPYLPLRGVEVRLLLETRDLDHIEEITRMVLKDGYILTQSTTTDRSFRPKGWR